MEFYEMLKAKAIGNSGGGGGGGGTTPQNFSTTEQNTGIKWIDGKDIYWITLTDLQFELDQYGNVVAEIGIDFDTVLSIHGISWIKVEGYSEFEYFDGIGASDRSYSYVLVKDGDENWKISTAMNPDILNDLSFSVVIYYTKSAS